jgi:hypothetical protein
MSHSTRFGSFGYACVGTVTNRTLPVVMPFTLPASLRIAFSVSLSSVEIDLVAAERNR